MKQSAKADYRTEFQIMISSSIASTLSTTITNPIEVAKLNRQYLITACPNFPHINYRHVVECGCGKFSFENSFKGLNVAIPQNIFSSIIYMQIYENSREKLNRIVNNSTLVNFTSAILARICVTTITIPVQSLRVRLVNLKQKPSFKANNGLKVTLIRDLIFSGLFWTSVESTRNYLQGGDYRLKFSRQNKVSEILSSNLLPGLINGTLIAALTTPLDILKTRIQSDSKQMPIIRSVREIYRNQGLNGLFSGGWYRSVKIGMHTTLYLMIYQSMMRHIKNQY